MNKQEFWEAYLRKHPTFTNPEHEIKIKVGSLKDLMLGAFDKGAKFGQEQNEIVIQEILVAINKKRI